MARYDFQAGLPADEEDDLLGVNPYESAPVVRAPVVLPEVQVSAEPEPGVDEVKVGGPSASLVKSPTTDAKKMFNSLISEEDYQARLAKRDELANKIMLEGGGESESRLASAAPAWYKGGKPSTSNMVWGDVAQTLGAAAAAPAAQRLKDPNRRPSMKQKDARKVALAGGMSTLFSNLFNRENTDRDAALKEAQMMKTIPGRKTRAQLELDAQDDALKLHRQIRADDSLIGLRDANERRAQEDRDTDSDAANSLRSQLRANNIPVSDTDSVYTMKIAMNAHVVREKAELTALQHAADSENARITAADATDRKLRADVAQEVRAEEVRRGQVGLIPDMEWNGGTPPKEAATIERARKFYENNRGFIKAIDKMRALQPVIERAAIAYAKKNGYGNNIAGALKAMGPVAKWTAEFGPEAKDAANEAAVLHESIKNYIRDAEYANMGVPQRWEDIKVGLMTPTAGSITAWLRGEETWKALRKDVDDRWRVAVPSFGAHLPGEPDPGSGAGAKTPEQQLRELPPQQQRPTVRANIRTGKVEPVENPDAPNTPAQTQHNANVRAQVQERVPLATEAEIPIDKPDPEERAAREAAAARVNALQGRGSIDPKKKRPVKVLGPNGMEPHNWNQAQIDEYWRRFPAPQGILEEIPDASR